MRAMKAEGSYQTKSRKEMKNYTAVIQAGGKGTRMRELTGDQIPKPMLMLNGKPMIQWQIENIARYGIREFVIIIGYLGEKITEYFGDGTGLGVRISYIKEEEPLGSAGALYFLKDRLGARDFLLVFGDVMIELDWNRMIDFHEKHKGKVSVLVHPNAHPFDSDLLRVDEKGRVTGIDSKNHVRDYWYDNCVNAGVYILSGRIIEMFKSPRKMDLEKDILTRLIAQKEVYGYHTSEYVKDAGTPERFNKAAMEQAAGIWEKKCLDKKQKCIFLDRDGTVNRFKGLISDEKDFELEKNAAKAIRKINESGFLAIVVTNQPVVARGMCGIEDVERIHRKMQTLLGKEGAYLDDIVFCPHHPDRGYPEENPAYKTACNCRKPAVGMIHDMAERYHIDLSESYMVGDSTVDIQTGINAGLETILVRTGQAGKDGKYKAEPDCVADDLEEAADYIFSAEKLISIS